MQRVARRVRTASSRATSSAPPVRRMANTSNAKKPNSSSFRTRLAAVGAGALSAGFLAALTHRHYRMEGEELAAFVKSEVEHNQRLPVDPVDRKSYAPDVPPPIERRHPARVVVEIESTNQVTQVGQTTKYNTWGYDGRVPGPFIRARVGDVLEVHHTNNDKDGVAHNIDFHGVTGPGGGGPALLAEAGETKVGHFKLLRPGLYIYHCAAAPVPAHVANGMYGLLLVEPEEGLPRVDKEFYVLQSEFYSQPSTEKTPDGKAAPQELAYDDGLAEHPKFVVFNGRENALVDKPLQCNAGDTVRFFFGNAGPNLVSSFHIIGLIFDKVYREGDLVSKPANFIQTTLVPAGGAAVITTDAAVPGNYTLVDHSIFRLDKGCVGFLKVSGDARPDIYDSEAPPTPCPGCKLHN